MLRRLVSPYVSVIGSMREVALTPRRFETRSGILFVGAIHTFASPNFDSLCWFIDEVLPLIEDESRIGDPIDDCGIPRKRGDTRSLP